jgi:Xaa-Pro aminopeptidase
MHDARLQAAARVKDAQAADGLLVFGLTNIRYLSGFTGSDAVLLLTGDDSRTLLCDSRYTLQARDEAGCCDLFEYKVKSEGVVSLLAGRGCRRVAFDAEKVPVSFFNTLAAALPSVELVPLADELDQLRCVKSAAETAAIEHAATLASAAFRAVLPLVKPGVSERRLAFELEMEMRRAGADTTAFDFIVASGERGALPHAHPTDRLVREGELVTFDFGVCCDGYNSDETVTVAVGMPDEKLLEIYRVVKEAHDLAIAAVRPGVVCSDLDAVARGHIERCGYGAFFGHGLGHGVGLEVHEKPVVSSRSRQVLEAGMLVTIEPGIYIPSLGGVRIEDLVAVTTDGCRILSRVNKELVFC